MAFGFLIIGQRTIQSEESSNFIWRPNGIGVVEERRAMVMRLFSDAESYFSMKKSNAKSRAIWKMAYRIRHTVPEIYDLNKRSLMKSTGSWPTDIGPVCMSKYVFCCRTLWKVGVRFCTTFNHKDGYQHGNFNLFEISIRCQRYRTNRLHWWQKLEYARTSGLRLWLSGVEIWRGLITAQGNWILLIMVVIIIPDALVLVGWQEEE